MKQIANGSEGTIYKINSAILKHKKRNSSVKDYIIQAMLHEKFPKRIPQVYDQFRTLNGNAVFLMEFVNAKNFNKAPTITKKIICSIVVFLFELQKAFPGFRHHDVHLKNIMLTPDEDFKLLDFGFSVIPGKPGLDVYPPHLKKDWGIFKGNHNLYDVHLFLNSVWTHASTVTPQNRELMDLVENIFLPQYLGKETEFVKNFRLRSDVEHTGLPTKKVITALLCSGKNKKFSLHKV
jgi:hypothetical protein